MAQQKDDKPIPPLLGAALKVLRENSGEMLAYKEKAEGKQTLRAIAKKSGNKDRFSTVNRVIKGKGNFTLKVLVEIADSLELQVWQLFYPGLEPDNLPVAITTHEKQVYENMRKSIESLNQRDVKTIEKAASSVRNPKLIGKYSKADLFNDGMGSPDEK